MASQRVYFEFRGEFWSCTPQVRVEILRFVERTGKIPDLTRIVGLRRLTHPPHRMRGLVRITIPEISLRASEA